MSLVGRHAIDGWRDSWTLRTAASLNLVAVDLIGWCDREVQVAGPRATFLAPAAFLATQIAPHVRAAAEPVIEQLMVDANLELGRLVAYQAMWGQQVDGASASARPWEGLGDIALAAGPLAGGAAVAAAVPLFAVTTASAWLGLVTVTTVSWPVVAVGGALAGTGIATGVINTARLREKFADRLKAKARAHVLATLIAGPPTRPAILQQLSHALATAADQAKAML